LWELGSGHPHVRVHHAPPLILGTTFFKR
jgi:hypothetical protein